jgi:hypothetical protein
MEWNTYSIDAGKMQEIATSTYETVVEELNRVGILSAKQKDKCLSEYMLVCNRKGFFGRAFDALFDGYKDKPGQATWKFRLVKFN